MKISTVKEAGSDGLLTTGGALSALSCAAAAGVALAVGGRLFLGGGLIGHPGGEVYGHAWVQWWHARALPAWPASPGTLLPEVDRWPVIDLVPTFLGALLTRVSGLTIGYNAVVLGAVVLAVLGGARAGRQEGGDPLVGALALGLAPSLLGAIASGLTEDLWVGLVALALPLVGRPDWRKGAISGLLLGLLAWCGPVLAWLAGLAAFGLGLAALIQDRKRWKSVLAGGLLAVMLASPLLLVHGERLQGRGHRAGQVLEQVEPLWRLNPWRGVDLLSFVVPGRVDPGDALVRMHPGYLGLSLLLLALLAGRSRWWWVLLGAVLVAPGKRLSFAGDPLGIDNPVAEALGLLPLGGLLNHHGRALLVGAVALSILAARGTARLPKKLRPLVALVVLLDLLLLGPVPGPLPVTPLPTLDVMKCHRETEETSPVARPEGATAPRCLDDLRPGAVLHLPIAGPGVHFQRPLLYQVRHQRPLLLNPNRPGLSPGLARTELGRWLGSIALPQRPPLPPSDEVSAKSLPGVAVILVEGPWVETVESALGPPDLRGTDSAAWEVGP